MTVTKSQGRETCCVGGRKVIKGLQTWEERKTYKNEMCHAIWLQMCFGNKILLLINP